MSDLSSPLYIVGAELISPTIANIDYFHRQAYTVSNDKLFTQTSVNDTARFSLAGIAATFEVLCAQLKAQADENFTAVSVLYRGEHAAALKKALATSAFDITFTANLAEVFESGIEHTSAVIGICLAEDLPTLSSVNTKMEPVIGSNFSEGFDGFEQQCGIAAVLLKTKLSANDFYLAAIDGVAFSRTEQQVSSVWADLYQRINVDIHKVEYVESSSSSALAAIAESQHLLNTYQSSEPLSVAVNTVKQWLGEGAAFTDLAGLIHSALVLNQRFIPGVANWQQPSDSAWYSGPFYFATESRPWYHKAESSVRRAAFNIHQSDCFGHIILSDNTQDSARDNAFLSHINTVLLPVTAVSETALLKALENTQQQLENIAQSTATLQTIRVEKFQQLETIKKTEDSIYTVALLGETPSDLLSEISIAKNGVGEAFVSGKEWKTPKGSYFSPRPVGEGDNVCFLYPGIGATYVGLGRDLFQLFPAVYAQIDVMADCLVDSMKDHIINPRSIDKPGFKELKVIDSNLRNHLADIAECGVAYAVIFTQIFQEVLNVKADFAAGYSMGEVSMFAGLGCWQKPGLMSERLAQSDTFNERLSGDLKALKAHWGIHENTVATEKLWETYTLKATPEDVAIAAEDEDRVYTTIINTPDSLVIGGDPDACQRVIKRLGVRGMALDMANAIHSPPAFKEYEKMEALYTLDVNERIDTKLYSSSCYLPVPQRSKSIANSIAKCLCDPVDFPRLINAMFDKGARLFVEVGPGRSLTSWTDKIIAHDHQRAQEAHASLPINAKGTADEITLCRAVAKLLSHGAPMDVKAFYQGSIFPNLVEKNQ